VRWRELIAQKLPVSTSSSALDGESLIAFLIGHSRRHRFGG
jgi:hypothetical protein